MANEKRPKAPRFVSPKGTLVFPKLNEPDTKFKADGEFATKLRVRADDPAVKALIEKLQPFYDQAMTAAEAAFANLPVKTRKEFAAKKITGPVGNPLYSVVYDETTEEPTGDIEFKFALPAKVTAKKGKNEGKTFYSRPGIFDAKGEVIVAPVMFADTGAAVTKKAGPSIWGGTVAKVSFEVKVNADGEPGYFVPGTAAAGLSLALRAVQILELVSGGEADAKSYGFEGEDGYAFEAGDVASEEEAHANGEESDF